jgi:RHS repeat-associated protein
VSGGQNNSRLTSITYPNGKVLNYNYATGVDSTISRLSSLSDNSGTLETLSYLGLGTVVKRAHPQPNVDQTFIGGGTGDAGDQYTGLDRFGRVVEQKWYNNTTATTTDDFKYGYDRNSNVLWRTNEINHNFDELYHANGSGNGYDNLNQLTSFARGTLNAGHDTISSPSHSINYTLDAEGNFSSTQTDGGSSVSNTFNKQNEETAAGSSTLTFDANGNLTTDDQGHTLVYDAWNRLVTVKNGGTTLTSYQYDALGRRIVENPGTVHDLYYDAAWQILEERWAGVSTATIQYVWSPVYVDAMILRDRSTQNNGTLDERLWVQQDTNWNVTALINGSASVVERYVYDPYGLRTVLDANFNVRSSSSYGFVNGFQGLRLDTVSGNYYARNRVLSPTLGRWTQADRIGFGGEDTNLYRLQSNSPIDNLDPNGLAVYWASGALCEASTQAAAQEARPEAGQGLRHQGPCALSVILAQIGREIGALIRPLLSKKGHAHQARGGPLQSASQLRLILSVGGATPFRSLIGPGSRMAERLIMRATTWQYTPLQLQFHSKLAGVVRDHLHSTADGDARADGGLVERCGFRSNL